MPFTLIKGRFKPQAGIPDGDSVRFLANNSTLWAKLWCLPFMTAMRSVYPRVASLPSTRLHS